MTPERLAEIRARADIGRDLLAEVDRLRAGLRRIERETQEAFDRNNPEPWKSMRKCQPGYAEAMQDTLELVREVMQSLPVGGGE